MVLSLTSHDVAYSVQSSGGFLYLTQPYNCVDKLNFLKAHFMPFTHLGPGGCCEGLEIA